MRGFRYLGGLAATSIAVVAACTAIDSPRAETEGTRLESRGTLVSSTLVPGVVADSSRELVYLMRAEGGIEALDLGDGSTRWTTEMADQPLFVAAGLLVAQIESTSGLLVSFLDPETGGPTAGAGEPLNLAMPAGVVAGIDQTLARTFGHAVSDADSEIFLTWEYIERDVIGMAPPGGRPFARRETGGFRFRPVQRSFEALPEDSITDGSRLWPLELREWVETRRGQGSPWWTGSVWAVPEQRYQPDRLILRRWRQGGGESLEEVNLHDGRAVAVLGSCDERHAVVAVPGNASAPGSSYLLRFFNLDTGVLVTGVESERSAGPFCLLGSRLIRLSQPSVRRVESALVESPLQVVVSDVESGAEVARRIVRDTAFRGAAPPRN